MSDVEAQIIKGHRKRAKVDHGLSEARIDWQYLEPRYLQLTPQDNFKIKVEELDWVSEKNSVSTAAKQEFIREMERYYRVLSTILGVDQVNLLFEFRALKDDIGQMVKGDDNEYQYVLNRRIAIQPILALALHQKGVEEPPQLKRDLAVYSVSVLANMAHELFHLRQFVFDSNADYLEKTKNIGIFLNLLESIYPAGDMDELNNEIVKKLYDKDLGEMAANAFQLKFLVKLRKVLMQMSSKVYFDELLLTGLEDHIAVSLKVLLRKLGKESMYEKTLQKSLS